MRSLWSTSRRWERRGRLTGGGGKASLQRPGRWCGVSTKWVPAETSYEVEPVPRSGTELTAAHAGSGEHTAEAREINPVEAEEAGLPAWSRAEERQNNEGAGTGLIERAVSVERTKSICPAEERCDEGASITEGLVD